MKAGCARIFPRICDTSQRKRGSIPNRSIRSISRQTAPRNLCSVCHRNSCKRRSFAVFTADFGATFPITKIQRWGFVTRIAPKAFAFVAPDETDFVLVPFAYFAHTLKATLVIIGADADENHRDFFFLGTPFTKHQFARVASHERTLPTEACFTTQKVLVAKVAQWHSLERVVT